MDNKKLQGGKDKIMNHRMWINKYVVVIMLILCMCASCTNHEENIKGPVEIDETTESLIEQQEHDERNISPIPQKANEYNTLNVATYVTKVGDTYYLADCYHNQIIYNDDIKAPLTEWKVLTNQVHYAHTIASDGRMFVIDDTENNRVVTFVKTSQGYYDAGVIENIGMKPHFTYYDEKRKYFMVWSSITGEMYYLGYDETGMQLEIKHISKIEELFGVYVRSFSVIEDSIYFVSGHNNQKMIKVNADALAQGTVEIEEYYPVTDEIAGMVQMVKIQDYYYISISTNHQENQDYATWIRTKDLATLAAGEYEDIYACLGIAKGTPYYITQIEGRYYMAHHRTNENLIGFDIIDNEINNVEILH